LKKVRDDAEIFDHFRLPDLPYVPGSDASGYVDDIGSNVTSLYVGQVTRLGVSVSAEKVLRQTLVLELLTKCRQKTTN
jgi:NADPH:quinone reductase-like Zn-dependent oxidoreductase